MIVLDTSAMVEFLVGTDSSRKASALLSRARRSPSRTRSTSSARPPPWSRQRQQAAARRRRAGTPTARQDEPQTVRPHTAAAADLAAPAQHVALRRGVRGTRRIAWRGACDAGRQDREGPRNPLHCPQPQGINRQRNLVIPNGPGGRGGRRRGSGAVASRLQAGILSALDPRVVQRCTIHVWHS